MDLTEAEDTKKRWWEYTEELYKKDIHDPNNHDDVITHLEPGILECEVKWASGSITMNKASGGDEILVKLFQILKDDAVKVLHSMSVNLENSAVATRLEKVSFLGFVFFFFGKGQFSFQSQRKAVPKNAQTIAQLHSSLMLAT